MDWSRVKTILIIAFLFANVFLTYSIYDQHSYSSKAQHRTEEVMEIIYSRGIKMNCDIPRDVIVKGTLTVRYREFPQQKLVSLLFNGMRVAPIKQDESIIYVHGNKTLEIKKGKEIIYIDLGLENKNSNDFTPEEAVNAARNFLEEAGLKAPGQVLGGVVKTARGYKVNFAQEYKGVLLEVSFVEMEITPQGIYSLHILWLDPVRMEKEKKRIIPGGEALLKIISSDAIKEYDTVEVKDVKLVYYFNWEDAKEGEAFPAWKIVVGQDVYYINALTGQFEK